jgi:hypothetical protein
MIYLDLFLGMFDGRPGDYLFMLLFNWACCVTVGLIGDIPVSITSILFYHKSCVISLIINIISSLYDDGFCR